MSGTALRCPGCGSVSTDPEFCSECGAAMAAAPKTATASTMDATVVPGGPDVCPVCGEARPGAFARYCDTCRYDFLARMPFSAAVTAALPPPAATTPIAMPAASPTPAHHDLVASVDVSLRQADDPMPNDLRDRVFPLDHADHLIGRRSDRDDIHPEIVVNDPGISRRHARILRAADGALSLLDLGSLNGTRLNGASVEANVVTPLADGDEITLGCWTRLRVAPR